MSDINIADLVTYYWTTARQVKYTPSGWISGNAVCCHHRGHREDTRKRGGIKTESDGSFVYSCFNCGFSTAWAPGNLLDHRHREFFSWLNIQDDDIRKMAFAALKLSNHSKLSSNIPGMPHFDTITFPDTTRRLDNETPIHILEYILKRRLEYYADNLYYCKLKNYSDLLMFPFYYNSRLVGWSGRNTNANSKRNRYVMDVQPGYIYGLDKQHYNNKFVIVTEGLIDSIHMNGIALLGSKKNKTQVNFVNRLKKPVIFVPDRDIKGDRMVDFALENNWMVSFPEWDDNILDVSDAVEQYGRIATFLSVVNGVIASKTKTRIMKRYWFKHD